MGDIQIIFVVESNSTCKSDWIYIKDTIEQFYQYDRAHVKLSVIYMDGKLVSSALLKTGNIIIPTALMKTIIRLETLKVNETFPNVSISHVCCIP